MLQNLSYKRFSSLPTAIRLGIALLLPIGILSILMMGLLPSPSPTVKAAPAAPLSPGYVDLSDWIQTGPNSTDRTGNAEPGEWHCPPHTGEGLHAGDSHWVHQVNNSEDPSFYLSPSGVPFSTTVTGQFRADQDGTKDFMGFVFGYQKPTAYDSDSSDSEGRQFEFVLLDWRKYENTSPWSGATLVKVDHDYTGECLLHGTYCDGSKPPSTDCPGPDCGWGYPSGYEPPFWEMPHQDYSGFTVLVSDTSGTDNSSGWVTGVTYTFKLSYTQSSVHIVITDTDTGNAKITLSCSESSDSDCTFEEGRFGFYNYSQKFVSYGRFEAKNTDPDAAVVANDDYYEVDKSGTLEVFTPTGVLVNDLSPLTVLSSTTRTNPYHGKVKLNLDGSFVYTPDIGYSGVDTFTYQAEDGYGHTSTATVYITVTRPSADLAVGKRDWLDPAVVNEPLTYTLTITNNGPRAANVTLTDTLSAGTTFRSASAGCNYFGGTPGAVACTVASLNDQATATITIAVTAPGTASLIPITNTAVVTWFGSIDPDPSNNTAEEGTRVSADADLTVDKRDFPDPATAGAPLTYTLVITNDGPDYAGGVVLTDDLPSGVMYDNVLLLHMDEAAGATTFKDASGRGNHASYTGCSDSNNDYYSPTAGISGPGGFDQALSFGEYDYVQIYPFNGFPATEITVMFWVSTTEDIGSSFSYAAGSSTPNGNEFLLHFYDGDFRVYVNDNYCSISDVATDGQWHHLAVTWRSSDGRAQAYVDGTSKGECTVESGHKLRDSGSLVFGQEQDGDSAPFCDFSSAGGLTPFDGDLDEVVIYSRTLLADEIEEHYNHSVHTLDTSQGACSMNGGLNCDLGLMAPNEVASVTLRVNVKSATKGYITNTAAATSYVPDPSPLNNTVTETTLVGRMPNLAPSKDAPNGLAQSPLTWTITVDNPGPSDAGNVILTDTLVGNVDSYGPISTTHGVCGDWVGNVFTCALRNVTVQLPPQITLVVTPSLHAGMLTNTVTVTETQAQSYERDPTDNTFTDTTPIGDIDLGVAKTVNASAFDPGNTVVYTITVVNNGPEDARDLVVSDTLPVGLANVLSDTTHGSYDDVMGVWNVGSLDADSTATLHITSTLAVADQVLTNTAVLSGSTPIDIIYFNNTATVSITVSATAVGGHTAPVSRSALIWPWLAIVAMLSAAAVVAATAIKRRDVSAF